MFPGGRCLFGTEHICSALNVPVRAKHQGRLLAGLAVEQSETAILITHGCVAFARSILKTCAIFNGYVAARVSDETRFLQSAGRQRNRRPPSAQHDCQEFMGQRHAVIVEPIAAGQQPTSQSLWKIMNADYKRRTGKSWPAVLEPISASIISIRLSAQPGHSHRRRRQGKACVFRGGRHLFSRRRDEGVSCTFNLTGVSCGSSRLSSSFGKHKRVRLEYERVRGGFILGLAASHS